MKLSDLIVDIPEARLIGSTETGRTAVGAVREDSRAIEPGDVFVAVRGLRADGHEYVRAAAEAGAVAVVVEHEVDLSGTDAAQVLVPHGGKALGILTARRAGRPADRLTLIGVTGTNGKTTTTYLIEEILRAAGHRPGVIGTVSYRYGGSEFPAAYTTPTPDELHRVFGAMVDAGCTHAVLEVSSAALAMDRLAGVTFAAAGFSNLTQDHLDLHGSMEAYRAAKRRLFEDHLAPDGVAVAVADDAEGPAMLAAAAQARRVAVTLSSDTPALPEGVEVVRAADAESTIDGVRARLETPRGPLAIASRALIGSYNVANAALATALCDAIGIDRDAIVRGIGDLSGVPGRVERVANDAGLDILVDYAHTPDALANVLDAVRPLTRRRLICVFGCGGDRDPGKRPLMGAAVAERADLAVVTSDNPRTEEPRAILDQILPAVPNPHFVDVDRQTAIRAAIADACPGDVVVIAGKGHEDYQILADGKGGTYKIHFDDREEAAAAAAQRPRYALADVTDATGGAATGPDATFSRVVIDGRSAAPGDLYVAIEGERFDGHDFFRQAVENGASGVVAARGKAPADLGTSAIEVDDTTAALGALGRLARQRWADARASAGRSAPLVGVTGSTGKTTTKSLMAAALGPLGSVLAPRGSLNNETGVPLSLLGLREYHAAAVIEMGMRGLGQIAYLVGLAEPTVSVVVNAGTAHLSELGTTDNIARAKSEIYAGIGERGGVAIAPASDERLLAPARASGARVITFGEADEDPDVALLEYHPTGGGADIVLAYHEQRVAGSLRMVGRHNGINAACAIAAALAAGVEFERAVAELPRAQPPEMRAEIRDVAGRKVMVDCYNANPQSMGAALATLTEVRGGHRAIAVVGDMLELGDLADKAHREAGADAARRGVTVVGVGELGKLIVEGARDAGGDAVVAEDPAQAAQLAFERTSLGDWLLVKASRGMRLERVVEALARLTGAAAPTEG